MLDWSNNGLPIPPCASTGGTASREAGGKAFGTSGEKVIA